MEPNALERTEEIREYGKVQRKQQRKVKIDSFEKSTTRNVCGLRQKVSWLSLPANYNIL